jgi:hypothetical protein
VKGVIILKTLKLFLLVFLLLFLASCQANSTNDNLTNPIITDGYINDSINQNYASSLEKEELDFTKKMSDDLISTINGLNDDDIVSVYVFLEQVNYDEVSIRLLTLGIDESIYRDEKQFLKYVYQLYGLDNEKIATERERYRTLRLQVIKQITLEANQDFVDLYDIDVNQIIYSSSYTTTLIISVTVSTLKLIASDDSVVELSLYTELIPEITDTIWTE